MATITPRRLTLKDGSTGLIRSLREDEAAAFRDLVRDIARESEFIATAQDEANPDEAFWHKRITDWNAAPRNLLIVAERDGQLVGDLGLRGGERRKLHHHADLGMGFIKSARGLGLGRAILQAGLDWAAAHAEIEKVHLGVFPENTPALTLYRAIGFREEGRQVSFFKQPDGSRRDNIVMGVFVKPALAPAGSGVYMPR